MISVYDLIWYMYSNHTISTLNVSITVDEDVNDLICRVVFAIQFFEIRHSSP